MATEKRERERDPRVKTSSGVEDKPQRPLLAKRAVDCSGGRLRSGRQCCPRRWLVGGLGRYTEQEVVGVAWPLDRACKRTRVLLLGWGLGFVGGQ